MTKTNRYSTTELPGDEEEAEKPFPRADAILPQGPGIPRRADTSLLKVENEQLKEQLEQFQEMLNRRSNALDVQNSTIAVGDVLLTPTGLQTPENFAFEDWEQIGHLIFRLEGAIQWLIGDWLVYGADLQYGDLTQIAEAMGRDPQTFYHMMSTCRKVEFCRRRQNLSFAHHAEVKKLTPDIQLWALEFAERAQFNVKQFRKWIKLDMPEAGLPKELLSSERQKDDDPVVLTAGSYVRYLHADPAKAKPQEHKLAIEVYHQMARSMEEYRRKWGIE